MSDFTTAFETWAADPRNVPSGDPVWRLPAYQRAIYAAHIAWPDVIRMAKVPVMAGIAAQLYRVLGSIAANLTEGYSRSSSRDRVRFYEYALGSAREGVAWYLLARPLLGDETVRHREEALGRIISMLLIVIPRERRREFGKVE